MNQNEVLELLKRAKRQNDMVVILPGSDISKVLIKVLEENRWIPVTERLPEETEHVLLSFEYFRPGCSRMLQTYGMGWQIEGHFHVDGFGKINVFEWKPLPDKPNM